MMVVAGHWMSERRLVQWSFDHRSGSGLHLDSGLDQRPGCDEKSNRPNHMLVKGPQRH